MSRRAVDADVPARLTPSPEREVLAAATRMTTITNEEGGRGKRCTASLERENETEGKNSNEEDDARSS